MTRNPTATTRVREELLRVHGSKPCDQVAERAGLLRTAGSVHLLGRGRLALEGIAEHPGLARRIFEDLGAVVRARGELRLVEPGRGHPRARYVVHADDVRIQRLVEAGILDESGSPTARIPRRIVVRRCCAGSYLRGAFLARGSVGDPRDGGHLEIRADNEEAAHELAELLGRIGAPARVRAHRGGWAAYLKAGESIGAALAAMGAHDAYLAWEESAVWKGVHVEVTRLANADAANARRLAGAAAGHLAAISEIENTQGLRSMPPALREIADLRRLHPDASLGELGAECDPPITKAAAADRLRRLMRFAGHGSSTAGTGR
ncbi:MAG TPA: DNA-binding protein WhiA [Actinomycetota bacterium]